MSFDEQLRRLFDTALTELTDVARADVDRARQEGVDQGRKEGVEEGRALGWEDGREHGRFEGQEEARAQAQQEMEALRAASASRPPDTAALDRLVNGFRAIDRARSLGETLDATADCAGRETARAAVLLLRGSRLHGWRFVGFDESLSPSSFDASVADAPVIADAITSGAAASAGEVAAFAQPGTGGSFALPLEVGGAAVAILYADGFDDSARDAGVVQRLEALGRHAARTLEALTALKAARALVQPNGDRPAAHADADDADSAAKRYAKLLVSEIKLYHEPAVVAGRRDRDLGARLGGEIARARVLYEQRVPDTVRARTDYFRDELVKTLANGDASLLQIDGAGAQGRVS